MPRISVVIPVYNEKFIMRTLESLIAQSTHDFEVIVVDDCSDDGTYELMREFSGKYQVIKLMRNESNSGPATSRNVGIRESKGEVVAFIDSDCLADPGWVENILEEFSDPEIDAVMGRVILPKSSFLGDCISALGFPAGGSVGFDKMWHVSREGFTTQMTTCNCAVRSNVFDRVGYFDESFPYSFGEDVEFSQRMLKRCIRINYQSGIIVTHRPRDSFKSFFKWALNRGRGKYHLKQKVELSGFMKLRRWSTLNILKEYHNDIKFPMILMLLFLLYVVQEIGYFLETHLGGDRIR